MDFTALNGLLAAYDVPNRFYNLEVGPPPGADADSFIEYRDVRKDMVIRIVGEGDDALGFFPGDNVALTLASWIVTEGLPGDRQRDFWADMLILDPPLNGIPGLLKEIENLRQPTVTEIAAAFHAIPQLMVVTVLESPRILGGVTIERAKQLASLTKGVLTPDRTPVKILSWFLSFGSLIDPPFIAYLARHAGGKIIFASEREFLAFMGPPANLALPPELDDSLIFSYQALLGTAGKNAEATNINDTFVRRLRSYLASSGHKSDFSPMLVPTVYQKLSIGIIERKFEAIFARYIISQINRPDGEVAAHVLPLIHQVNILLQYAGLQAVKLAHEFTLSDTSQVWLYECVVHQANALDAAWRELEAVPNHEYSRLLGTTPAVLVNARFPDMIYCAVKAAKNRNNPGSNPGHGTKYSDDYYYF